MLLEIPSKGLSNGILFIFCHWLHIHARVVPGDSESWHLLQLLFDNVTRDDLSSKFDRIVFFCWW